MEPRIVAPTTWYVYTYQTDTDDVFYVGKGTGARIFDHEREAIGPCTCNKCNMIRYTWDQGKPVRKRIVYETLIENDAFLYEWILINMVYGPDKLTNVSKISIAKDSTNTDEIKPYERIIKYNAFRALRIDARLTVNELAVKAGVSTASIGRIEKNTAVLKRLVVLRVLDVLSKELNKPLDIEDFKDLRIAD